MSPAIDDDPSQAWSHHWQQTLTGSIDLMALTPDPVAAALREFWSRQTALLQAVGSVVDVGSGPAILARLMGSMGWTAQPSSVWWCIDRARLGHDWRAVLPAGIRVLDDTDFCHAVPPNGPVDVLVSNFGLEYLPLDALAQALPRWLRAGGSLRAVLHARGSIIDSVSRQNEQDLELALHEVDLHARAAPLIEAMATAPTDPVQRMMHGVDARDAYNAGINRLKQTMEDRGQPSAVLMDLLQATTQVIRHLAQTGPEQALRALQRQRQAYQAELERLRQMQASALDAPAAQRWLHTLRDAGVPSLQLQRLDSPLGPVGWNLQTSP